MKVLTFEEEVIDGLLKNTAVGVVMRLESVRLQETQAKYLWNGLLPIEAVVDHNSRIEFPLQDHGIPPLSLELTKISLLRAMKVGTEVNVIGVVLHVGEVEAMSEKKRVAGKSGDGESESEEEDPKGERMRREVQLVDDSAHVVRIALWKDRATSMAVKRGSILLLKKVVIAAHGGISLNVHEKTKVDKDPKVAEGTSLKNWYNNLASNPQTFRHISSGYSAGSGLFTDIEPRSSVLTIPEVQKSNLGTSSRVDTFNVEGRIQVVDWNAVYEACRNTHCNKSIEKSPCDIEGHEDMSDDNRRFCYHLKLTIGQDRRRSIDVPVFTPLADKMLEEDATEVVKKRDHTPGQYDEVLGALLKTKWRFTIQACTQLWKNEWSGEWSRKLTYVVTGAEQLGEEEGEDKDEESREDVEGENGEDEVPEVFEEEGDSD
ncbi:nucleic acid-binding protein [Dacryopinax primogenitus]|uniref:Nucleic acid-binding protein n=1 Tax=Dacryopinax primogenitus (strain DJM 731) TaxID=1858805 RepID=M5FQ61_DACPD|nr:nucleic acid-binding protein [Dacryopinax primogenitus]EJT96754.1 nucleic acid-binding protein [Dacryopinax primogenitus]